MIKIDNDVNDKTAPKNGELLKESNGVDAVLK